MRILQDSGCGATLINHSLNEKLKTSKDKKLNGQPKLVNLVPRENAELILLSLPFMSTEKLIGIAMWTNQIPQLVIMI